MCKQFKLNMFIFTFSPTASCHTETEASLLRTEKEVVTASGGSVGVGVVVENWSSYTLTQPQFVPNYGVASGKEIWWWCGK